MKNYLKNSKILEKGYVYSKSMEHDACGVGLIASTEGKKSRKVVEHGINALKAVFHRGAVDADGKTEPLTDGLLIIRRLFGFSGDALISEAVPEGATRTSADEIEEYIDGISQ